MASVKLHCLVILSSVVFSYCSAKSLPTYIEPCSESDPKLNECIKNQANQMIPHIEHGDKKFRIPNLSPLIVDSITTAIGRLSLAMKDLKIYGLANARVESAEYNKKANTLSLKIFIPEVLLQSTYTMKGQILILPVEGKGPMEIILTDATFFDTLSFENLRRDSPENIKFLDSELDYKFKNISLRFDNLFNGNKQLGDRVNKLLNEEQGTIERDFKSIFIETINSVLKSIVLQMFTGFHYSDLFKP